MQPTGIRKKMHDISLTVWRTPSVEHAFVLAMWSSNFRIKTFGQVAHQRFQCLLDIFIGQVGVVSD